MKLSYPRSMRESAKREGKQLITLSACGVTIQRKVDEKTAKDVLDFMFELMKKPQGETN